MMFVALAKTFVSIFNANFLGTLSLSPSAIDPLATLLKYVSSIISNICISSFVGQWLSNEGLTMLLTLTNRQGHK